MKYATFREAKQYVRAGSEGCGDQELGRVVNTIRRHFYNWYAEAKLFADAVETFRLQRFSTDPEGNGSFYNGITLPREVANVEGMWWNHFPIEMRSSWREYQVGMSPFFDCRIEKFDVPGYFSTALDIVPGIPRRLRFKCDAREDEGKTILIRGVNAGGAPFVASFVLSTEPNFSTEFVRSIDAQGGVVKEVTKGRVSLADEDGRLLAVYEPDETVPAYRRIRLTGLPLNCSAVNVRSARRYFPLTGDDDVVETDNEPAFDAMARYLRSYGRTDRTTEDARLEKDHLITAKQHILGDKAREMGQANHGELKIVTPGIMSMSRRLSCQR